MDCKASVKIAFEIYGKKFQTDMWINYWPDECGVDGRVLEFFRESHDRARAAYLDRQAESDKRLASKKKADWPTFFVQYEGRNGSDRDRNEADVVLRAGQWYAVKNVRVSQSASWFELDGEVGLFNTVMFRFDDKHPFLVEAMENAYPSFWVK